MQMAKALSRWSSRQLKQLKHQGLLTHWPPQLLVARPAPKLLQLAMLLLLLAVVVASPTCAISSHQPWSQLQLQLQLRLRLGLLQQALGHRQQQQLLHGRLLLPLLLSAQQHMLREPSGSSSSLDC